MITSTYAPSMKTANLADWCRERGAEPGDTIVITHVPTDEVVGHTIELITWSGVVLSDGDECEDWDGMHPDYQFHLVRKVG